MVLSHASMGCSKTCCYSLKLQPTPDRPNILTFRTIAKMKSFSLRLVNEWISPLFYWEQISELLRFFNLGEASLPLSLLCIDFFLMIIIVSPEQWFGGYYGFGLVAPPPPPRPPPRLPRTPQRFPCERSTGPSSFLIFFKFGVKVSGG